jgi:hypothetical protein
MSQKLNRSILALFLIAIFSSAVALAQSSGATEVLTIPTSTASHTWQDARSVGSPTGKLLVVTVDQPDRRQTCRVHSFTEDKLVCSRPIGGSRTYLPQQVLALIIPGDEGLKVPFLLGFNAAAGAAIWGTVILAAACPACAVATGIVALLLLGAAGAIAIADDQPARLLYLAPDQKLSRKLGYVQR